jgi:hypothetical protein
MPLSFRLVLTSVVVPMALGQAWFESRFGTYPQSGVLTVLASLLILVAAELAWAWANGKTLWLEALIVLALILAGWYLWLPVIPPELAPAYRS